MKNRRTVPKILYICDVFVTRGASYIDRKNNIYQHLQHPTQEDRGNDVLGSFYFERCPPGVSGADRDGLVDTQDADATNGRSPPHPVKKEKKFTSEVTKGMFPPKCCHGLGDSFTEQR